ncbi:HORMA domain containing protein [Elaphomyces granulatus]
MARTKFTGPPQTTTTQQTPTRGMMTVTTSASTQKPKQTQHERTQYTLSGKQTQLLHQQQSQEMVQIMLHVAVKLMPLPCFGERDLKVANRENISYQKFISTEEWSREKEAAVEPAFGQGKRGQPLKILIRNRDPKVDSILDLLENGIFDALKRNVLEALQMTVIVDKNAPENVLESYTFSFKYTGALGELNTCLSTISLGATGCVADMRTMQTARLGIEMIVRRLITLTSFLPMLPNKRYLEIHLFYTDNCPQEYEPPGFNKASSDMICFPSNSLWRPESQLCGRLDSGYHTVGLKVTSLKWIGPEPEESDTRRIPHDIEYRDSIPRIREIDIHQEGARPEKPCTERNNNSLNSTQARQDAMAKEKLQKMVPAARHLQTTMLICTVQTKPSTPDPDLIPTQVLVNGSSQIRDEMFQYATHRVQLSQSKTQEMKGQSLSQGREYRRDTAYEGIIRCQCGWNGEEPEMIKCSFCCTRQHLLCYGFNGPSDPRLPDIHACYRCLIGPNETYLLQELNTIVLLRRALGIIIREGYPNRVAVFSHKLHCNGHTVVQVTDLLRKQGFLQATPGCKSKGFLEKGLPKYSIPRSPEMKERIRREILDPMVKIKHHYVQCKRSQIPQNTSDPALPPSYDGVAPPPDVAQNSSGDLCQNGLIDVPSLHAVSLAHKDHISQSPPQSASVHGGDHADELETRSSDDELIDLAERSQGQKRPAVLPDGDKLRGLIQTGELASNIELLKSKSKNTHGKPGKPSKPSKRRKMSNAGRPLDVGATTTDDDSS